MYYVVVFEVENFFQKNAKKHGPRPYKLFHDYHHTDKEYI